MVRRALAASMLVLVACGLPTTPSDSGAPDVSNKTTTAAPNVRAIQQTLDKRLVELAAKHNALSITARLDLRDRVTWFGEVGYSDAAKERPIAPTDQYRVGSITKTFVGALIFQLEEEGKLSIEEPLSTWYPDYPNADAIKVRNLLGHTSGVFDYIQDARVIATGYLAWEPDDLIARAASHGSQFEPDTQHVYTQTNFVILGRIVEKVTGKSFRDALHERITTPLGLHHTDLEEARGLPDLVSGTETVDGQRFIDITNVIHPTVAWTAGGIVSTTEDLLVWSKALYEDAKVISRQNVERMCTPLRLKDGTIPIVDAEGPFNTSPGLACFIEHTTRGDRIGHRGETGGFTGNLIYQPGVGHAVVLSNTRTAEPRAITEELWRTALDTTADVSSPR